MTPAATNIARRFAAAFDDLDTLREKSPDEAEAIRCVLVAQVAAMHQASSLSEQKLKAEMIALAQPPSLTEMAEDADR